MSNITSHSDVKPSLKSCFIITPIGGKGSIENKKAFELIDSLINPVIKEFGFEAVPSSKIAKVGSINNQIISHIIEDELVIANLTGLNPNVMYELAVRHAAKKPVICLVLEGTVLPFDIKDERTIFYEDSIGGTANASQQLKEMIPLALADEIPDNPITRVLFQNPLLTTQGVTATVAIVESLQYLRNTVYGMVKKIDLINASRFGDSRKFAGQTKLKVALGGVLLGPGTDIMVYELISTILLKHKIGQTELSRVLVTYIEFSLIYTSVESLELAIQEIKKIPEVEEVYKLPLS